MRGGTTPPPTLKEVEAYLAAARLEGRLCGCPSFDGLDWHCARQGCGHGSEWHRTARPDGTFRYHACERPRPPEAQP